MPAAPFLIQSVAETSPVSPRIQKTASFGLTISDWLIHALPVLAIGCPKSVLDSNGMEGIRSSRTLAAAQSESQSCMTARPLAVRTTLAFALTACRKPWCC